MIVLRCQCCNIVREFVDGESAFNAGWDAPPHFSGPITCDLCPASGLALGVSHKKAHEHWELNGRPYEFNETCALDDQFGISKEQLALDISKGKELALKIIDAINERMTRH